MMLDHINPVHHNIQFTFEREEGGKISFLDVEIHHNPNGSLSTNSANPPTRISTCTSLSTTLWSIKGQCMVSTLKACLHRTFYSGIKLDRT